jgi:hypothetical protein
MRLPTTCPVCRAEMPLQHAGRPSTYCSKRCRQGAHRAKQRARAAVTTAVALREAMDRDLSTLENLARGMDRLLADAIATEAGPRAAAIVEHGLGKTNAWQADLVTGWEQDLADRADHAARLAAQVARAAREHARAVAEHRQALTAGGIGRIELRPRGKASVATTAAATATTKPGPDGDADGDRDEVIDAIEDLIIATDITTSAGSQLSDDLSDAVTEPAARLAELFAATTETAQDSRTSGEGQGSDRASGMSRSADATQPPAADAGADRHGLRCRGDAPQRVFGPGGFADQFGAEAAQPPAVDVALDDHPER